MAVITGDAPQVADTVGVDLGIDEVFAEVLPQDNDARVAEPERRGSTVAMVGVNDAPALARADVGIAIGAGTMSRSSHRASCLPSASRAA